MMLAADVRHTLQLLFGPHAAAGVMRITEQEHRRLLVGALTLKVIEVDAVGVAFPHKLVLKHLAALVADGREEAVVGRRLQQHFLAGQRKRLDGTAHGGHHAGGVENPVFLDMPVVATVEPVDDSLVIAIRHERITKHGMLHAFAQCFLYRRCHGKVHVSHPPRNDIVLLHQVPLIAVGTTARHHFVEIVFHAALLVSSFSDFTLVSFRKLIVGHAADLVSDDTS